MRVILLGNGPFAVPLLDRVAASRHRIALVVTRPDRPQGKHQVIIPGPVHARAEQLGLPIAQPPDVNAAGFVTQLADERVDLLVVADFGQILSPDCLATARLGGINVHASLLPKYRGAAPVAWAIYHGETQTGVSVLRMTPQMDAGGVLIQAHLPIEPSDTAGSLEARLATLGAEIALDAIDQLEAGTAVARPQDPKLVSKAPRLKKEDGRIQWDRSGRLVDAQIRAMQPWPIAYTDWNRRDAEPVRLQILEVQVVVHEPPATVAEPGTVVRSTPRELWIATGASDTVAIRRLKPAGKREMDIATFLQGRHPAPGDKMT